MAALRDIGKGDRVKVNHKGRTDTATVQGTSNRLVQIDPDHPKRFTWREVAPKECEVLTRKWRPSDAVFTTQGT